MEACVKTIYIFDASDPFCMEKANEIQKNTPNSTINYETVETIKTEFPVAISLVTKEMEEYLNENTIEYWDICPTNPKKKEATTIFNPDLMDEFQETFNTKLFPLKKIANNWCPTSTFIKYNMKIGRVIVVEFKYPSITE